MTPFLDEACKFSDFFRFRGEPVRMDTNASDRRAYGEPVHAHPLEKVRF